jgi:hypothetical protein
MKNLKQFMELLDRDYRNYCCCISLANFGKDVKEEEYTKNLSLDCSLIRKEDGTKYIKTGAKEIKITKKIEELTEEEKTIITDLIEKGTFDQLKLERWLENKKNTGNTHYWRTGIADDDMQ